MGIFRKAEKKLEGLVEGGFGRAFKSSVQPVELAHKLVKEMRDHKTVGVSNVYVPHEFDIYLGGDDFEHLSSFGDSLKSELGSYVTAFAKREGWTLVAPPHIDLRRDDDLRIGEFGIATGAVNESAAPAGGGAGWEAPAAAPSPLAPPAAVAPAVVPAVAPTPGSLLDQTVLYQEAAAARPAQPRAEARAVLRGPDGEWELRETVTVIGRSRRCDIVLTDANVSRQHAEVRRQGDDFVVRDLGSTNGTRVNRRDVKQAALRPGDRLELGTTELRFERLS